MLLLVVTQEETELTEATELFGLESIVNTWLRRVVASFVFLGKQHGCVTWFELFVECP